MRIERSGFAWMKAHKTRFKPPMPPGTRDRDRPDLIRRGQAGKSGELLTPEHQRAIDRFALERLRHLQSDFPYGEKFNTAPIDGAEKL